MATIEVTIREAARSDTSYNLEVKGGLKEDIHSTL